MTPHKRPHSKSNAPDFSNTRARTDPYASEEMLPPQITPDIQESIQLMLKMGLDNPQLGNKQPLSPLTPLSDDENDTLPNIGFVRVSSSDYCLEGEDLSGPREYKHSLATPPLLTQDETIVRKSINEAIIDLWPNSRVDAEKVQRNEYSLANPCAFWSRMLRPTLKLKIGQWINAKPNDVHIPMQTAAALTLLSKLRKDVDTCTPFNSTMLKAFYQSFMDMLKGRKATLSLNLQNAMEMSAELGRQIKRAYDVGQTCLKQAKWIGVDRSNAMNRQNDMHKHMIETQTLLNKGKKSGAIDTDGDALLLGNDWNKVCAPRTDDKMFSLIYWNTSNTDDTADWDLVFGATIHNMGSLSSSFTDRSSGAMQTECQVTYENVLNKTAVVRGITDEGLMVKNTGSHATFGTLNQPLPPVQESLAANPTLKTLQRTERQKQLRVDFKSESSAIQARSFAFLMGFLPPFAYKQYEEAKKYGLLNDLGTPDVSSFATFAYGAGIHVDRDVCPSHGWVFQSSPKIKRKESNFVYGDYKLIVELSHDCHWFWDSTEGHGTTSNVLAMGNPSRWKDYIMEEPDAGQWTTVRTIPLAVAMAAERHPRPEVW